MCVKDTQMENFSIERRGISYSIEELILSSWMTVAFVTYVTERKSRRFEGDREKRARRKKKARQKGIRAP